VARLPCSRFRRRHGREIAATLALLVASGFLAFPVVWMALAGFKTNPEIYQPLRLLPTSFDLSYYRQLLGGEWIPYYRQYGNALVIAGGQTVLVLGLASAAAFVFAGYRFPLRSLLYALALTVILVPQQALVVPLFEWLIRLGLASSLAGVILPGSVSGLAVLFFTEMIRRIPGELLDQARVEGASEYGLYLWVVLPLLRPALLTYAFIHFLLAWHDYLLALIVLASPERMPVAVGLGSLFGSYQRVPYAVIMAGFTLTTLPAALAYLAFRKHLRSSLSQLVDVSA
jgi:ABC-type glycerol-3-phosphate transport system permease component